MCLNFPPVPVTLPDMSSISSLVNFDYVNTGHESAYFLSINRNKRSIACDLKHPKGKQLIYDLAKKCDVLVENFIPGKLEAMDLGYEKISSFEINPNIIYCSITGFGEDGPYSTKGGYDVIIQSLGGMMSITGLFFLFVRGCVCWVCSPFMNTRNYFFVFLVSNTHHKNTSFVV